MSVSERAKERLQQVLQPAHVAARGLTHGEHSEDPDRHK